MLFFPSYWKLSFISDAWQKTRHADDGHPGSDKHEKKKTQYLLQFPTVTGGS